MSLWKEASIHLPHCPLRWTPKNSLVRQLLSQIWYASKFVTYFFWPLQPKPATSVGREHRDQRMHWFLTPLHTSFWCHSGCKTQTDVTEYKVHLITPSNPCPMTHTYCDAPWNTENQDKGEAAELCVVGSQKRLRPRGPRSPPPVPPRPTHL